MLERIMGDAHKGARSRRRRRARGREDAVALPRRRNPRQPARRARVTLGEAIVALRERRQQSSCCRCRRGHAFTQHPRLRKVHSCAGLLSE